MNKGIPWNQGPKNEKKVKQRLSRTGAAGKSHEEKETNRIAAKGKGWLAERKD
jgi:hypothetical protein